MLSQQLRRKTSSSRCAYCFLPGSLILRSCGLLALHPELTPPEQLFLGLLILDTLLNRAKMLLMEIGSAESLTDVFLLTEMKVRWLNSWLVLAVGLLSSWLVLGRLSAP